jgi:predicted lipoprotein with Yx(FWY)xxD motif
MKIHAVLAVAATAVLTLSACGSNTAAPAAPQAAGGASGLHGADTSLGRVLVDASGRTVYLLTADGRNRSTCAASCLQFWPAVTPRGGNGVSAQVGATPRTMVRGMSTGRACRSSAAPGTPSRSAAQLSARPTPRRAARRARRRRTAAATDSWRPSVDGRLGGR